MKVLIITWLKYNNYGTLLQSYALQKKIKMLGYDVKTLDDHGVGFDLLDKKMNKFQIIMKLCLSIIKYPFTKKKKNIAAEPHKQIDTFDEFKNKYIDIEYNLDDKRYLNNHYQAFVTGSDQIWSPLETIFSKHYYLDFVDEHNSKISYAPSMGQSVCSEEIKAIIKPLLKDFEYISVRENQGKQILSELTDKEIKVVLDPTLLLSKDDWSEIVPNKIIKNKYFFTYFVGNNAWYSDYLEKNENIKKMKIFSLDNDFNLYLNGKVFKKNISPEEFLSLIKYAEYVVTDSFHGTIFSIIFEKDFVCLKRFEDNAKNNQNSRLYNLLKIVDLEERFVGRDVLTDLFNKKIDYGLVNKRLKNEISKSEEYLINALQNCKGNKVITHNCTSCMACFNACPVNAIKIEKDKYGEYRPFIDESKCIKCGKCKEICPSNNLPSFYDTNNYLYGISTNKKETLASSAGGIAYELGKKILLSDGIVYGVVMDANLNTKHIRIDNILALQNTQGSKYAQSFIGDTYRKVKEDLKRKKDVLFIGSPCQIAGLRKYLNDDYDNLITVDFVCHGNVPNEYIRNYVKAINKETTKVTFKEKRKYCLKLYKGNKVIKKQKNDKYLYAFSKNISLKESCYHCVYAKNRRVGDITLGDFWKLDSDIPYSIIMINTHKGQKIIDNLDSVILEKSDINRSSENNPSFNYPPSKHTSRIYFNRGVVNGFNNGLISANINKTMRRDSYPKVFKKILSIISNKVNSIRNGQN